MYKNLLIFVIYLLQNHLFNQLHLFVLNHKFPYIFTGKQRFINKIKRASIITGMFVYHFIQYSLLLIVCTYLVNYYAAKTVSFQVKFWSVITWTLNFAITLLVPQDVYETLNPTQKNTQEHEQALSTLGWQYLILYWLVYLLTWTIIPVLQEWENSGDLESSDRLKRSLKVNGIFYLWMIAGAVVTLVILIWLNVGGDMGLLTFLKCLATIWGLLLLMSLMGYALVQIPKTLWNNAEPQHFLTYLYQKVNQVQDQIQESYQEFTKIVGYILYAQRQTSKVLNQECEKIQLYCNESKKIIPPQYQGKINYKQNYADFLQNLGYFKDYPISLESSIQHHRLLKRSIAQCKRMQRTFNDYCAKAILYEDILNSIKSGQKNQKDEVIEKYSFEMTSNNQQNGLILGSNSSIEENLIKNRNLSQPYITQKSKDKKQLQTKLFQTKWYHSLWYLTIRKPLNKFLAVLIGTCAVVLLISQTQVFLTDKSSILGWLLTIKNFEILRIVVFIVIVFIMYMVNYSLFRLKLSNLYGLYEKDSDGPSLMFATVNFSRVGVVIVLNFFDMIKMDSQYKTVMGTVDMGLLGQWVIRGLPGILWLMVLTHYFNFWGKLMDKLKLNDAFSFTSHELSNTNASTKSLKAVLKKRIALQKMVKT